MPKKRRLLSLVSYIKGDTVRVVAEDSILVMLLCCVYLSLFATLAAAGRSDRCKALTYLNWLDEYAKYHKEHKGDTSVRTFTIYKFNHQGIGWGDVFRELIWGLRYAIAHQRVYYIHAINDPIQLLDLFEPTEIDWRIPADGEPFKSMHLRQPLTVQESRVMIDETDPSVLEGITHLTSDGILMADYHVVKNQDILPVNLSLEELDGHCLFAFLFTPTAKLQAAITKEQQRLFGNNSSIYSAIHIRGINLRGSENLEGAVDGHRRGDEAEMLVGSLFCARQWGKRVYLASSDQSIRQAVLERAFGHQVVGPVPTHAVHVAYSRNSAYEDHFETLVELGTLAGAKCLVVTASGFSNVARWWGGAAPCERYVGVGGTGICKPGINNCEPYRNSRLNCYHQLLSNMTADCVQQIQNACDRLSSSLKKPDWSNELTARIRHLHFFAAGCGKPFLFLHS
eukprot:g49089.t1